MFYTKVRKELEKVEWIVTDMFDNANVEVFPMLLILLSEYVCATQRRSIKALNPRPAHDLFLAEELKQIARDFLSYLSIRIE